MNEQTPVNAAANPDASATVPKTGIETHQVVSSQIAAMSFNHDSKIVTVGFTNGQSYEYQNVDYERFQAIVSADSVGKAFNSLIKSNPTAYPFKKL